MLIKNENLANTLLRMPSGKTQQGGRKGVFQVDEEDGRALLETPGWTEVTEAELASEKAVSGEKKAIAQAAQNDSGVDHPAPKVTLPDDTPVPSPAEKDDKKSLTPTDPPPESDDDEDEAPDLATMTKAQLLQTAIDYDVKLTVAQKNGKVDDLRAFLDKEIYGDGA